MILGVPESLLGGVLTLSPPSIEAVLHRGFNGLVSSGGESQDEFGSGSWGVFSIFILDASL